VSIFEWDMTIGSTSGTTGERIFSVRFQEGSSLLFALVFRSVDGTAKE